MTIKCWKGVVTILQHAKVQWLFFTKDSHI